MTLFFALLLDAIFGEPKSIWDRIPHPAVLMGHCVQVLEKLFNKGGNRKAKGVLCAVGLTALGFGLGLLLSLLPSALEIVLLAILLAHRSLIDHVRAVSDGLRYSVQEGRSAVAMIVGRDTANMSKSDVARAAIESAAENYSDGIVAPVFWYLIAGLPGIIVYKFINTADSMIGYKTDQYKAFGWASARFDDLLNWLPARITAIMILAVHCKLNKPQFSAVQSEAQRHRSPNAGWPEAALAPCLGIALAGPRSYHGTKEDHPWVNPLGKKELGPQDIEASLTSLWKLWSALVVIALFFAT